MAQACQAERWNHTAAIMMLVANAHRDPRKGRAFTPADFHPLLHNKPHHQQAAPLKGDLRMLKSLFVDRRQ